MIFSKKFYIFILKLIVLLFIFYLFIYFFRNIAKNNYDIEIIVKEYDNYCTIDNIITRNIDEFNRITLILHSSYDKIDYTLQKHAENWDGPISLAIEFPKRSNDNDITCITNLLMDLRNNNPSVAEKLSVHYMISSTKDCNRIQQMISFKLLECRFSKQNYSITLQQLVEYPINMVRNYARNMSNTKYILLADMDHFFSKNFEQKMLHLANRFLTVHPKMVLVYRIFEVKEQYFNIRETKTGLAKLIKEKRARLFHGYFIGHYIPKILSWLSEKEISDNATSIQFYNPYRYNEWEPQFVSLQSIPFHDPSFRYPLHDNAVLRWEMCRADYVFAVVNDVFMYHPGMKTKEDARYFDIARYALKDVNEKATKNFWKKMDEKYPKTKDKCHYKINKNKVKKSYFV